MIADIGCYTDREACDLYDKQEVAKPICQAATDCKSCMTADAMCGWSVPQDDTEGSCFVLDQAGYYEYDSIVSAASGSGFLSKCPAPKGS